MSVFEWFGAEDEWERPGPAVSRGDVVTGATVLAFLVLVLELMRSFQDFTGARPRWVEFVAMASLALLVVARRRWPLPVMVLALAHMFVCCTWVGEVGYTLPYQGTIFFLFYSAVSWGRDRRMVALVAASIALLFVFWLAWDFAVGQSVSRALEQMDSHDVAHGMLAPAPAFILLNSLLNLLYVGGAMALGQSSWRQARDEARLAEQAELITRQAEGLRDQAVVDERLRIARELHDVVAHHVSVMGIQAAGARRLLEKDPPRAAEALGHVEESSRTAVTQMRSLLGALRGATTEQPDDRAPQPTLAELPALVEDVRQEGLDVELRIVEVPQGAAASVPLPVQLSVYRTAQEALTNVRRHSTARRASVVVRVEQGRHAEVEVLDDGRPRGGTSGSGLGLLGMRERVTSHGGESEIGPRVTGGFRVRVRFPLSKAM